MLFDSYSIALLLLTAPTFENTEHLNCQNVRLAMQDITTTLQLLDTRESRYTFSHPNDFKGDLILLQRRYKALVDAPLLEEGNLFSLDRDTINQLLTANRQYRNFLNNKLIPADEQESYHEAIQETDYLYNLWDALRDAKSDIYYIVPRRAALKKLRDQLGYTNFYNGTMPPHVPIWRFFRED